MHVVRRRSDALPFSKRIFSCIVIAATAFTCVIAFNPTQTFAAATNDPLIDQQWGLVAIGAPSVWSITRGAGVTVAVIDSGSGPHPDLDVNMDVGRTIIDLNESVGMRDVSVEGHGTHVAGIIAAVADNGIVGAGVAPQARILPIRTLVSDGSGRVDDVSKAIIFATNSGAKVINLSLGRETDYRDPTNAIQYAVDRNVLVVAAAGNAGVSAAPKFPAANDLTLAVTAVDRNNGVTSFDQRGEYIDLAAPGSSILSTASNDYKFLSGTSMAAAFVSGAAALLFAAQPSITAAQVRDVLQRTATDIGAPGRDTTFGFGVVNLVAAFAELDVMFPKIISASLATEGRIGALAVGTASTSSATTTSQWYRCTAPGDATSSKPANCTAIANAVATSYKSTIKDLRKFLRYAVTIASGVNNSILSTTFSATAIPESGAWISTSTLESKTKTPLGKLLRSPSKGLRTFRVVGGSCKLRKSALIAPAFPGVCKLKISIAAKAPFPKLGFTAIITFS